MFAIYADGTSQELKFGQKIVGLQKKRRRPISFTVTQKEIEESSLSISQRERYAEILHQAIAISTPTN